MNIYDLYKSSGIEWVGETPGGWNVKRLKHLLIPGKAGIKIGPFGSSLKSDIIRGEGFKVYGQECVIKNNFTLGYRYIDQEKFKELSNYEIFPGDIVITMMGTTGKAMVVPQGIEQGIMDSHLIRIRVDSKFFMPKLLAFLVNDSNYIFHNIKYLSKGSIMEGLNSMIIKSLQIVCPSIPEQFAIASYLDHKTEEIDNLIADKKRLLELYEEEKTAIINQAVTKGINPDVPLKDSGIEWLGEIPEHWEVKRLKYIAKIVLGKMLTSQDKGNYYLKPYLRAANLNWLKVDTMDVKKMWFSDKELDKYSLKYDDLLVSEGGEVGRTCIWKDELDECYIQNSVHKVTISKNNNSTYFLYQFLAFGKQGVFDAIVNRISIAHLTAEKLREISFIVPPYKEQQAIVIHIETVCGVIDNKIQRTKELIKLLTEYRTTLINEVVTGKIKVTD